MKGITMRDDDRGQVLKRYSIIEGHLRGVRRMIEDGQYCPDIIKQTTAIQGAIDSVNALILENHLFTCATAAIRSDDLAERERVIGELVRLFRSGPHTTWSRSLEPPRLSVFDPVRGATGTAQVL